MIYLAAFLFALVVFGGGAWFVCEFFERSLELEEGEL